MSCLTPKGPMVLFAGWASISKTAGNPEIKDDTEITERTAALIEVIHLVNNPLRQSSSILSDSVSSYQQWKFPVSCKLKLQTYLQENMLICKIIMLTVRPFVSHVITWGSSSVHDLSSSPHASPPPASMKLKLIQRSSGPKTSARSDQVFNQTGLSGI